VRRPEVDEDSHAQSERDRVKDVEKGFVVGEVRIEPVLMAAKAKKLSKRSSSPVNPLAELTQTRIPRHGKWLGSSRRPIAGFSQEHTTMKYDETTDSPSSKDS
jgi:hypothetical protein